MHNQPVDLLYNSLNSQHKALNEILDITDLQEIVSMHTKYLIIAAASFFEHRIKEIIIEFALEASNNNKIIEFIIKDKITERGYHSLISWKEKNPKINTFFKSFSISWADHKKDFTNEDIDLYEQSYIDFVYLGHQRNLSVHGNLVKYSSPYSFEDAYIKYISAHHFINLVPKILYSSIYSST